jgi:N-acetylglucosamine kinase-like BadF-type ATPase
LGRRGWGLSQDKARNHMAAFAHEITFAAAGGSELANWVCRQAASSIAEGIGLVGQCFQGRVVPVVLSGSTVQTEVISSMVAGYLERSGPIRYSIQEPKNYPLIGAVQMALQLQGVDIAYVDIPVPIHSKAE